MEHLFDQENVFYKKLDMQKKGKIGSISPLGVNAVINGELHRCSYLQLEYPKKPNERPADLAPGIPGFYAISVRASTKTVRWMEACFESGSMTIEIQRSPLMVITYSKPVDAVTELPLAKLTDRLLGRLSASFGFYQASVNKKKPSNSSKLTLTA